MYKISVTGQFKKDYKKCIQRNLDIDLIDSIILTLEETGALPIKYKPHTLHGNYNYHWECHIEPDWLLIWLPNKKEMEIKLVRTGTHSDLF